MKKKWILILELFISLLLGIGTVLSQSSERIELDGSGLSAGQSFRFTVTVDSDEMRSFADAQTSLTAVLCPLNAEAGACQTLTTTVSGEAGTSMKVTFTAEALPAAGDYTLEIIFDDSSGEFASQTASYLLRGVKEAASATAATPTPEIEVPITVKPVKLSLSMLDQAGNVLGYGSTIYVGESYTLQIRADNPMNDSVNVTLELPASLRSAPLDPQSGCFSYLNGEGSALILPGSLWNEENGGVFRCGLRYDDRIWLPGEMVKVNVLDSGLSADETFEMAPLNWNAYPTNVTQYPATHQAQISDSRGNLLCSDTVPCGMFSSDEVYILTYRFPSQWGAALPSGRSFTADVRWPAEWAASVSKPENMEKASAFGEPCTVGPDGITRFELEEISEGRYAASCVFTPGAVANSVSPAIGIHLNDNSWAVRDLNVGLSPVIIRTEVPTEIPTEVPTELPTEEPTEIPTEEPTEVPTEEPTEVPTEEPTEVPTEEPTEEPTEVPTEEPTEEPTEVPTEEPTEIPAPVTVTISVTLNPSMRDEAGNNMIYGSTLYVGEPYILQIESDRPMNDSVVVNAALPATLLAAPLDPASECLTYMNAEGTGLSIPGNLWNSGNDNTFRCELRFTDSAWMAANPVNFSIDPSGIYAEETYEMDPLSWNYYPVSIAKFAATHQVQVLDSRGNLICSDNVPCGVFNADDVYTFTYKFPADWGDALPSGKSFTAELTWPDDWGMGLQMAGDWDFASQFGTVCSVSPDGRTYLDLTETSPGRYSASCTFAPSSITNPSQAPIRVHLNDNSYNVNDLNVYLPGTINKQKAVLSPSLTMQVLEGSAEEEQIRGGTVGQLYRTTSDYPNNGDGFGAPALYTLKAQVEGISALRTPQWGDHVTVKWAVLDALARTGDLPGCLVPAGDGYELGTLTQTDSGIWQADCSFRFPLSMPEDTQGGTMQMELVSGLYSTSASAGTAAQPFAKKTLTVDLDIPEKMILNQPMDLRVSANDEGGGLSDYTRAVLAQMGANIYSDWDYNYLTTCQGSYDLSAGGEDTCTVEFNTPTDSDSYMHFEVASPGLDSLFNVEFRPGADVHIAGVSKTDVSLSPSLTLQTVPGVEAGEQISGGWVSSLYRTAADMPNSFAGAGYPALYTLRADVSGVYPGSQPRPDDSVLVNWNVLDALAMSGDLPACLVPDQDGFRLGELTQNEEGAWTASCDLYFPLTMAEDLQGGELTMRMVSSSYDGSVSVQMNGNAFRKDKLYIDVEVPEKMVLNQPMEIRAHLTDDSGGLSEYALSVISQTGAELHSDWEFNYATSCQGVYDLSQTGEGSCTVEFLAPTNMDSTMHFELMAPGLESLFNVEFRPGSDIYVASIDKTDITLSPSLSLQMMPGSDGSEQISGGWISGLYRTAAEMPNNSKGGSLPALYTLRANIEGVFEGSRPQGDDSVLVRWNVLDALALSGDLPSCLIPSGDGYQLGMLEQSGDRTWTASCELYFPMTMQDTVSAGDLTMELVSEAYQGSASTQMNSSIFRKDNLYIDVNVPEQMVLNQPMEIRVRMSDDSGGMSEYLSAVTAQTGADLYSDWLYNSVTTCQGVYDLSDDGEDSCGVEFYAAADQDSTMHFELTSPGLAELFNVTYRPGADIPVSRISKLDVTVAPSLSLQMTPYSGVSEQIGGGWIGTLYRTASEEPNLSMSSDLPARYTLRANISGVFAGSRPMPEDHVQVEWPLLDALAVSGNLPVCLSPAAEGYSLGVLEQTGEREWTASCDFYFPETLQDDLKGDLKMQLVSGTYQGAGSAQMSGNAFKRENLYVDLDIPAHMLIRQMTEFRVRVSDDSGSLSEYSSAVLNASGSALYSDWVYNYVTTCQGLYDLDANGNAACSALFEAPTDGESVMHFELASPALENLFNVTYRPSEDINIAEVKNPGAVLSVKLFHAGTEMPLPASDEDVFHVGEAYQFQFYLTPDPEFHDVMEAIAVDSEGLVIDWWEPLRIHWGMLPGGETGLNFYRDGDHFIARYDFDFEQGGLKLEGILSQLVIECWIDNWDISGVNDMVPIRLPGAVDKHPVSLQIMDLTTDFDGRTVTDVYVNREAQFDVAFSGSLDHFDPMQMRVGYDANGITTDISCTPDPESGTLHCSFIPQCTDLNFDEYPAVCGTNLKLFAEYGGDTFNDAGTAEPKTFNVRRGEVSFTSAVEGSLSRSDLLEIQEVQPDLENFGYGGVRAGTWNVDSFLPREIRSQNGSVYRSYQVVFRYQLNGEGPLDESLLHLDVKFQTGTYLEPQDDRISLLPRSVTDDTVIFDLDFGSMEMLSDGRMVREALDRAVQITGLEVRYSGSPLIGPASAAYRSEELTFALKVATVLDFDLDISSPGIIRFGGGAIPEMQMMPFNVYCSQLYQMLQCSAQLPLDVLNENGEPILSEMVGDGCWGTIQTVPGRTEIYVNNSVFPQCYLSGWSYNDQIYIGMEIN